MAGEIPITVVGSITEPELKFSQAGKAIATFSLAQNSRVKDGDNWVDGEPTWFRVSVFGPMAENIVESLEKGARVIVQGGMKTNAWEKDGEKRTSLEIIADAVGPDLRWATAKPVRQASGGGQQSQPQGGMQRSRTAQPQGDPWADQPPF
jgi:single-strand DNA-binding protein